MPLADFVVELALVLVEVVSLLLVWLFVGGNM